MWQQKLCGHILLHLWQVYVAIKMSQFTKTYPISYHDQRKQSEILTTPMH